MIIPLTVGSKQAIGYVRVSGPGQVGERHSSLETQQERFLFHCKRQGYRPGRTFCDVMSGRRDDRREYQAMLSYVRANKPDVIVVQWLDRFGRNPREILRRYWELEEAGVRVEATDEDLKEEMLLLVRAGMAGAESRRISEEGTGEHGEGSGQGRARRDGPLRATPGQELRDGGRQVRGPPGVGDSPC